MKLYLNFILILILNKVKNKILEYQVDKRKYYS